MEYGDLIVETDQNKYVIPLSSEGDIEIGPDIFSIVGKSIMKRTEHTCSPEDSFSYEEFNFFIFDRKYFGTNPDYEPLFLQCNEIEE